MQTVPEPTHPVQVAQSSQLQLDRFPRTATTLPGGTTTHSRATEAEEGGLVSSGLMAEALFLKSPVRDGLAPTGKSHAGMCAGAVG